MDQTTSWLDSILAAVSDRIRIGIDYLPGLVIAVLILAIGWALARIARGAVQRLAAASNRLLERAFPRGILATARVSSLATTLIGEIVFWVILLVAVTLAARSAGFSTVSDWLNQLTTHLPNLVAGSAIVVVGYLLGVFAREQIAPGSDAHQSAQRALLGRSAQAFVLFIAVLVGLDQIGIDVALLIGLTSVAVGALLAGLAIAFALGARRHVSNLLGALSARRQLSVGTRIRIGALEGDLLEITATQIALDTDEGKTLVPGSVIDDEAVIIVVPVADKETGDV